MKKRIVLASLLKTVDDPRMYYKFARSIQTQDKYDINIVGFPSKSGLNDPSISFHPLPVFKRKSLKRWEARIQAARTIWGLKPDLLIISTHELLGIALFCRFFRSAHIMYDVREDYAANLRFRGSLFAHLAAFMVRMMEYISAPFIDHFILAESSYRNELRFARPCTILENRALKPDIRGPVRFREPPAAFLFTGTLARQTGVMKAIEMVEAYKSWVDNARLHIIGNSFDPDFLSELKSEIKKRPWIQADIDEHPLPYPQIIDAIENSEIGIIAYEELPFLIRKKPTKYFEYTGHHLPIVFLNNNAWYHDADALAGAILWNDHVEVFLDTLRQYVFYPVPVPKEIYWDSQEIYLLELINTLLNIDN